MYSGYARQSSLRNKFLLASQSSRHRPCFHFPGVSKLSPIFRGPRFIPCRILSCGCILWVSLREASHLWGFSCYAPDASGSFNSSSLSLAGLPKFSPLFGLESQIMSPSISRWRLSNNNQDSHQSNYRGWSLQALHSLLPGVLEGAIFVASWEFP